MPDHIPECNAGRIEDERYQGDGFVGTCQHPGCGVPISGYDAETSGTDELCPDCVKFYLQCEICKEYVLVGHLLEHYHEWHEMVDGEEEPDGRT
jgi:hypothetical protein